MSLMFYVPGPFTQISTATFKSNIMLQLSHDSKDCTCVTIPLRGGTAPLDGGVLPLLLSSPTACTPESSPLVPNKSILMYSALSGPRELKPRWTHKKPAACICGCPLSHKLNTAYCDKMRTIILTVSNLLWNSDWPIVTIQWILQPCLRERRGNWSQPMVIAHKGSTGQSELPTRVYGASRSAVWSYSEGELWIGGS